MTPLARGLLGAVFGAAFTLAVHPTSRSFLIGVLAKAPAPKVAGFARLRVEGLPTPSSPMAVSIWLQTAADKLQHGLSLSQQEIKTLLALDDEAAHVQRENAFWPQMKAVLLARSGSGTEARAAWIRASQCQSWDDLQTQRLLEERARLVRLGGWNQAWTFGYTFFGRSDAAAAQVKRYAQALVSHSTVDTDEGLRLRYATIRNGSLLRDGSRSIRVGAYGSAMIEIATYPPSLSSADLRSPKRIWIAQTTLTSRLRQMGFSEEAKKADEAFGKNEAWLALTERESPEENNRNLCLVAVGLAALPGSLALGAALGLGLYLLGRIAQPRLSAVRFFGPLPITAAALVAAILVFEFTFSWIVCLSVGLTVGFLCAGPANPRTRKTDDLGPFFQFALLCIWILCAISFSMYVLSTSTAATALLPYLGPAGEYLSDSQMFSAVSMIALSLLCLTAPAWAIVRRYGTPDLLGLTLRRFGTISSVGCLIACVVSGPLTIYGDRLCAQELSKILENEPVYYLIQ